MQFRYIFGVTKDGDVYDVRRVGGEWKAVRLLIDPIRMLAFRLKECGVYDLPMKGDPRVVDDKGALTTDLEAYFPTDSPKERGSVS
jgi:hypothetical protein